MGKLEWYFGGRSSSSRRVTTADVDHSQRRRHSLPSCMSTLFHFFHFRSSHFTHFVFDNIHHSSSFDLSHEHHPALRPTKASHHGVEAPRNSLELDGESISCLRNKEEFLQLQMGLQNKTRNGSRKSKASDQQLPNNDNIIALESPSTKTPNLLARLMGLDNFPQTFSSSYCRCGPNLETRSLSESPRNSSSRLSDVDCHHRRLSLQINIQEIENNNIEICEEIIKREKKKVGRKVALVDITNSNYNKVGFKVQKIGSSQSRKVEMKSLKKLKKLATIDESSSSKVVCRNQKNVMVSMKQKLISMPIQIPKERAREREAFDCPTSNYKLLLNHSTIFEPCGYPKGKAKPAGGETNAVDTTTTIVGRSTEFRNIKTIQIRSKENSNWPVVRPSTFHHVETTVAGEGRRWKKRLELQMAVVGGDRIPNSKSWWQERRGRKRGWEFPHAKFELVEYALVNKDLEKSKLIIMAEEREGTVKLVELHILDSLLRETLSLIS